MDDIFTQLITTFTAGLITDVKTLVLGLLGISFLVAGFDIIMSGLGFDIGGRLSSLREKAEYNEYAKKRALNEQFSRRYEDQKRQNQSYDMGPAEGSRWLK
jgi:hypothetical protein